MEKILIIDGSQVEAANLKSILEDTYDITIAQTADAGLKQAGSGEYYLVLMDIVMPGMDGFELLKKLQEHPTAKSIPVIITTSLSTIESEQRSLMLGAVDYIVKPYHPLIIKARVNTHINLYKYRRQIEYQSMTDQLTGIPNRRYHDQYSPVKWQEAIRLQAPFSICMFDIDHFKAYNDTYGHPAGDKVLASIAGTISTYLQRVTDFVARYGGEEFIAIILGDSAKQAFEYLKKVRQAVEMLYIHNNPSVSEWVTISIGGVTVTPQRGYSYDDYLKIADAMLYDAKRRGRNRVVWADDKNAQWHEI